MQCTLSLQSRFGDFPVSDIEFYPQHPKVDDIDEQNPVFEDGHYLASLTINDAPADVETAEVFLNGDTLIGRIYRNENGFTVRFENEQGNETAQPFQLLYDLLELSLRITFAGLFTEAVLRTADDIGRLCPQRQAFSGQPAGTA